MDTYRVKLESNINLRDWDPRDTSKIPVDKITTKNALIDLTDELENLQELMYAEQKQKLLIILQGMDTSGKDGTIRHVFEGVNPQGVQVASFKVPTAEELAHDYLWRIHKQVPGKGMITIFNRSHYEDLLVVRVHSLVPKSIWSKRFEHINSFEKMLTDEGTTILKFFLHISLDEQKERLQARLDDPTKQWKFNPGDLKERALWGDYIQAYQDVLSKTSTSYAPWFIVPSDRKWVRNYIVATTIVDCLKSFRMSYPQPTTDLDHIKIE